MATEDEEALIEHAQYVDDDVIQTLEDIAAQDVPAEAREDVEKLDDEEVTEHVKDCDAVVSCLGHVMNFKGIFGEPKKLCTDTTRNLCNALEKYSLPKPTKFILMNTVGVQNPDLEEKRTWFERGLLTLLRHTLPPPELENRVHEVLEEDEG